MRTKGFFQWSQLFHNRKSDTSQLKFGTSKTEPRHWVSNVFSLKWSVFDWFENINWRLFVFETCRKRSCITGKRVNGIFLWISVIFSFLISLVSFHHVFVTLYLSYNEMPVTLPLCFIIVNKDDGLCTSCRITYRCKRILFISIHIKRQMNKNIKLLNIGQLANSLSMNLRN